MDLKQVDWDEILNLVNNNGNILLDVLKSELDVEEKRLEEIIAELERGGIDVLSSEEKELRERIANGDQVLLPQTDEPLKLYLREMKDLSLLTREGEYRIGTQMERGRKRICGYLFQSIPVIDKFLDYQEDLKYSSLPVEQFLYVGTHEWPEDYGGEKERQVLLKSMKSISKWREGLIRYKDAYLETGKMRYKRKYKRYEERIIDKILSLRIQTPYLKRILNVQKEVFRRIESEIGAIRSLKGKLGLKMEEVLEKSVSQEDVIDEKIAGIAKAIKSHRDNLAEFEKEIHSGWKEVYARVKKIQKWEGYFNRAKRQLVKANIRLVIAIVKKYFRGSSGFMDAIQEGNTGLVRAVEKFDHLKGYKFSTYAIWWIKQSVAKSLAEQHVAIRVPVHAFAVINKIKRTEQLLVQEKGIEPTLEEISERTGFSIEKIKIAKKLDIDPLSLDEPSMEDGEVVIGELISDPTVLLPERRTFLCLLKEYLEEVLDSALSPREKKVLQLRFGLIDGDRKTLEDIGMMFNVTRERIRQIEANAIRKIKRSKQRRKLETFLDMGEIELY